MPNFPRSHLKEIGLEYLRPDELDGLTVRLHLQYGLQSVISLKNLSEKNGALGPLLKKNNL